MSTIEIRIRSAIWLVTAALLGIAATLIVTSAWSATAAPGDVDSTFVPTAGCRLVDTRPGFNNVGPRNTPLGPGDIHEVDVHGSHGLCTGALAIPTDAVGIALNVTAANATTSSNIRIYPANLTRAPLLSNLNVTPGGPPTPNKVDVQLSPDGAVKVFNFAGTVDVIFDVVGYYTNTSLTEIDSRLGALEQATASNSANIEANAADIEANGATIDGLVAAQPFAQQDRLDFIAGVADPTALVTIRLTAPVDGHYTLIGTTAAAEGTVSHTAVCSISLQTTSTALDPDYSWAWESGGGGSGGLGAITGSRVIAVAEGTTTDVALVCANASLGDSTFRDSTLTAIFTPAP